MRGDPQAANARLLAVLPGRGWSTWVGQIKQSRTRARQARLEVIERLEAEERRARRSGEYAPDLRRLW